MGAELVKANGNNSWLSSSNLDSSEFSRFVIRLVGLASFPAFYDRLFSVKVCEGSFISEERFVRLCWSILSSIAISSPWRLCFMMERFASWCKSFPLTSDRFALSSSGSKVLLHLSNKRRLHVNDWAIYELAQSKGFQSNRSIESKNCALMKMLLDVVIGTSTSRNSGSKGKYAACEWWACRKSCKKWWASF